MKKYLAFDIGGTKIKWGILNEEGAILEKASFDTRRESEESFLENIIKIALERKNEVEGVAISMPGFIDSVNGIPKVCYAIRCIEGKCITKIIEEKTGLKASVENDGKCVALAEKFNGNATECSDFVCVTIGTGIGGGIYVNNKLLRGSTFQGGEFGFMRCNEKGMYSNTASTLALIKEYMKYKNLDKAVDGQVVFEEGEKDPKVKEIINEWYGLIAIGIYNLSATLNPEKILIGGGVSEREEFIEEVVNALENIEAWKDVKCVIERCKHKNDAGMIGAVYNFLNE
ncbi:MAG: ROK family protein [Clostridium paraputrificum]|uniref:ROK family protein n=1 Tax=Clostridium TaxID=1485 RepID=UPI00189E67A4|nr:MULTISPECIES: ROK family protein [Clostridium]